ncbi:hypothetical protein Pcinc_001870 [Petrolisthes cinctipes]|uniref:Uncharacterized protein n=1 Tax=Petrolisthes cinctipes TaxID=88211 RepID=A0AAE1GM38_PETCI|nr:hypothetical protein Pcinc_001870 [Petrolisthes cinctipes]
MPASVPTHLQAHLKPSCSSSSPHTRPTCHSAKPLTSRLTCQLSGMGGALVARVTSHGPTSRSQWEGVLEVYYSIMVVYKSGHLHVVSLR